MLCCVALNAQTSKWGIVVQRDKYGDYEGVKRVLDTMTLGRNRDSVLWYNWMGQYYFWLSYEERSQGARARECYERAIECGTRNHVSGMPYGYYWLHLGELEYLYGEYDKAIENLKRALTQPPYKEKRVQNQKPACAVYKGLGMCYAMKGEYERALGCLDSCPGRESGASSSMRMRGKILAMKGDVEESRRCYQIFIDSMRSEVRDSFVNARNDTLREAWWMRVRPFVADCWRLEGAASELLYDVALMSKGILLQATEALDYRCEDVRRAMSEGEVAIEWMVYEKGGEKRIGAVVMPKEGETRFVETGLVADINDWLYDEYSVFDEEHSRQIWSEQMMSAIGGAEKIYFAPDGVLNQIGIEYMFPDTAKRLYRLTSTRELIKRRRVDGRRAAAVIGGMEYDTLIAASSGRGNDELAYEFLRKERVRARKLVNSQPECESVIAVRHNEGDTLLINIEATEQNFRAVAGRYGVLLVSTHGYCRTKEKFESSDFPRRDVVDRSMSESGLLFSGVNRELKDRQSDLDGILSAKELSEMDLSGVDVCVVSACEGARGRVSVDGSYGLQRGLKAAGVGGMVLSLWEVNDESTRFFMTQLCRRMEEGMDVHDAFWRARSDLRDFATQDGRKLYDTPSKYNAFILIDVM